METRIFDEDFDENKYMYQLAELLQKMHSEEIQAYEDAEKEIRKVWKDYGQNEIFDLVTGGVKIADYEWKLDKSIYKDFFALCDATGLYYSIDLDDSKLLRGPLVYYYLVCFKKKGHPTKKKEIIDFRENIIQFLNKSSNLLRQSEKSICEADLEKKYILGIVDNIRNIILICINIEIGLYNDLSKFFLLEIGQESKVYDCVRYISRCYRIFEKILFGDCNIQSIKEEIKSMLEFCVGIVNRDFDNAIKLNQENYNGYFRLHREADSMYENYVTMKYSLKYNKNSFDKLDFSSVSLCGILSGALELPIVFNLFFKRQQTSFHYVNIPGEYLDRHKELYKQYLSKINKERDMILFDDNVMTGSTVQHAVDYINNSTEYNIRKCFFLRHPEINRIYQMKAWNKAVSIGFLRNDCFGYINHSPYSKIKKETNFGGEFLDELGIFTLTGEYFLKYLFKNGLYEIGSEVDYFAQKTYFERKS